MMRKLIPTEVIVGLYYELANLSPRHPARRSLIETTSRAFNVSLATVRRAIKKYRHPHNIGRSDYNTPRKISKEQMLNYCELIAALKMRSTNKKGKQLSTPRAIEILENHGVDVEGQRIISSKGLLKKPTINRYLKGFGLNSKNFNCQPLAVRFQATKSNECWQLDFTPSDLKHIKDNFGEDQQVILASIVDDRSGMMYQEYHLSEGENVLIALKFLFNAMSAKSEKSLPFQGIPEMLYMDNGPVAKSLVFQRVCKQLGITLRIHMPAGSDGRRVTARSKGKVERAFNTVQNQLESLYHFQKPSSVEEANSWLKNYLIHYNSLPHRHEEHSRLEDWQHNLPQEGYRQMCSWERFCQMARHPDERLVDSSACIIIEGVRYQLIEEMAGEKVMVLVGLFDNELYVEFHGQKYGPFYQVEGPIPINTYRAFKKTSIERRIDKISAIAKQISLPRSVLSGQLGDELKLLTQADMVESKPQPFIAFSESEIEQPCFQNALEAKLAIAKFLGRPLATLSEAQRVAIDHLISEGLNKSALLGRLRDLFQLRLVVNNT